MRYLSIFVLLIFLSCDSDDPSIKTTNSSNGFTFKSEFYETPYGYYITDTSFNTHSDGSRTWTLEHQLMFSNVEIIQTPDESIDFKRKDILVKGASFSDITPLSNNSLVGSFFYDRTEQLNGGIDDGGVSLIEFTGETDSDGYDIGKNHITEGLELSDIQLKITSFTNTSIECSYEIFYKNGDVSEGVFIGTIEVLRL